MQFGKVKFFDSRENRRFGFIVVDDDRREIFFHRNDYVAPDNSDCGTDRTPKKGDRLAFEVAEGRKGDKASPWAFADEMPLTVNGGDVTIKLVDIPSISERQLKAGDQIVYTSDKCFGPVYNGVGWTDVILRPSTGELFRLHCYDCENGGSDAYVDGDRLPTVDQPDNLTIIDDPR